MGEMPLQLECGYLQKRHPNRNIASSVHLTYSSIYGYQHTVDNNDLVTNLSETEVRDIVEQNKGKVAKALERREERNVVLQNTVSRGRYFTNTLLANR